MDETKESNLHECLLQLRRNELTPDLRDIIFAAGALSWVTLDLVPRSLRLVFLNAKDQRRVELAEFLENILPEHVSYQLVESFHGVDAVLRGQLPSGWIPQRLTLAPETIEFMGGAIEFLVTPIERFRWKKIHIGGSGLQGSHFNSKHPKVEEAFKNYLSRLKLRFIYNPTRLPIFPVYALIKPKDPSADNHKLLSNLASSKRLSEPIRDLFLILERKEDGQSNNFGTIFKKRPQICGIAVCEFMDETRNGHPFQHSLERFHAWRNDVLKEHKGIHDISCLPFIAVRESYEGGEDPDSVLRIKDFFKKRLPFANPGYVEVGLERTSLTLDLPIGDLVVCGTPTSGRSILAMWCCRQFLAAGFKVIYVAVTKTDYKKPPDNQTAAGPKQRPPSNQKFASLFESVASEAGPVKRSRFHDVRDHLKASRPLAIYTEIREERLIQEDPDVFVDWLERSSSDLFVVFDEIQGDEPTWLEHFSVRSEGKLHLGFVCRNVDESPAIKSLALSRANVIITNLSASPNNPDLKPPNFDLAERLLAREIEGDKPQVPIDLEDMASRKSVRNFVLFPRPKVGSFTHPVRGFIPSRNIDSIPSAVLDWSPIPGESLGPQVETEDPPAQTSGEFDVFISHSSKDKEAVVEPLVEKLRAQNIIPWYDTDHINLKGDFPERINAGLRDSKLMIVVLSQNHIESRWATRELSIGIDWELSSPEDKIVLLLVGTEQEQTDLLNQRPILRGKPRTIWDNSGEKFAKELRELLGK